jgi:tight adherence protein B
MNAELTWILVGAFVCLVGLGITGVWMLSGHKKEQQWSERRELTIGPYLKPKTTGGPALVVAVRQRQRTERMDFLTTLFNWREDRRAQYPMTWWGVALCMMGPATIGGLLASKVLGSVGWFGVPIFDVFLTRIFLGWSAARVSRQLLAQFPDALAMVSRSVRVGVPLGEAIRIVARESQTPTREEFTRAADQMQIGLDLEAALLEMAERNDLNEYRFFATALALQAQTGGGLTETLETLADTIRKRENARKRGIALAAEAKTSIMVLAALPVVIGAILFVMNPEYIGLLFTDPTGEKILGLTVFLLIAGLVSMQQIIKRSLS